MKMHSSAFSLPNVENASYIRLPPAAVIIAVPVSSGSELSLRASSILDDFVSHSLEKLDRHRCLPQFANNSLLHKALHCSSGELSVVLDELLSGSYLLAKKDGKDLLSLNPALLLPGSFTASRNAVISSAMLTQDQKYLILNPTIWVKGLLDVSPLSNQQLAEELNVNPEQIQKLLLELERSEGYQRNEVGGSKPTLSQTTFSQPRRSINGILKSIILTDLNIEITDVIIGGYLKFKDREITTKVIHADLKNKGVKAPPQNIINYSADRVFAALQNLASNGFIDQVDPKTSKSFTNAVFKLSAVANQAISELPLDSLNLIGLIEKVKKKQ